MDEINRPVKITFRMECSSKVVLRLENGLAYHEVFSTVSTEKERQRVGKKKVYEIPKKKEQGTSNETSE